MSELTNCQQFNESCDYAKLRAELAAAQATIEQMRFELLAASNYIDCLGGDSKPYRIALALPANLDALHEAADMVMVPQEVIDKIEQWSRAYPTNVFPEPDFDKVREALEGSGITLDSVSASNMRHVITEVWKLISAAEGK